MFKLATDRQRRSGRHGHRLAASLVAIALATIISGPVAAVQLRQELPTGTRVLAGPARSDGTTPYAAKLRTTAGYQVLVFG